MHTNLVAISSPQVEGVQTAEEFIAYCARVSNPGNQLNMDTADKLVKYLIRNQHWSPFEMVSLTIEIVTTRDIGRQILRHRSFAFQEFSQRYAKAQNFTYREARLQDKKNRQNSLATEDEDLQDKWLRYQHEVIYEARELYNWALDSGIAKEQARAILPEGLTESTMYMAGTLRSWIHYCQLRMANGTQKEHQDIALACWNIISQEFPSIAKALEPEPVVVPTGWRAHPLILKLKDFLSV